MAPDPEPKPVKGDVVGPHVQVGQVQEAQLNDHQRAGLAPELGNHDADAQYDLSPARDVDPEFWPAEVVRNDGDECCRVDEVLDPHPDEWQSVQGGEYGLLACWGRHAERSVSARRRH